MGGIQGLGGINGPQQGRPVEPRPRAGEDAPAAPAADDLQISASAREAAERARIAQSSGDDDVRRERVAAARAALERQDYKNPDILSEIAKRIARFV